MRRRHPDNSRRPDRRLRDTWECSEPEVVEEHRSVRLLRTEVEKTSRGYSLSQRGYLQDLLREHAITDHALLPVPEEWCSVAQDEEQVSESDIGSTTTSWIKGSRRLSPTRMPRLLPRRRSRSEQQWFWFKAAQWHGGRASRR